MKDKVAPILRATVSDVQTPGVKDIGSFLRGGNFYRRHVPNFTYSSHLLTDLIKEDKRWQW